MEIQPHHESPVREGSYSRHYHRPDTAAGKSWDNWVDGEESTANPGMRMFFGILALGMVSIGVVWFVL